MSHAHDTTANKFMLPASSPVYAAFTATPRFYRTQVAQSTARYVPSYSFGYQLGVAFAAMAVTVMVGLLINPAARTMFGLWL